MLSSLIILIILSLFVGVGVWLIFIWAVKRGEFDDIEGPKYRMMEDEDETKSEGNTSGGRDGH